MFQNNLCVSIITSALLYMLHLLSLDIVLQNIQYENEETLKD